MSSLVQLNTEYYKEYDRILNETFQNTEVYKDKTDGYFKSGDQLKKEMQNIRIPWTERYNRKSKTILGLKCDTIFGPYEAYKTGRKPFKVTAWANNQANGCGFNIWEPTSDGKKKKYWIDVDVDGTIYTNEWQAKNKSEASDMAMAFYQSKGEIVKIIKIKS